MPKTAVIFDYGKVISRGEASSPTRTAALQELYGITSSDVRGFFGGPTAVEASLGGGKFTTVDMIQVITERLQDRLGAKAEGAAHLICSAYLGVGTVYEEEVLTLIEDLHVSGVRLGILTNGPADVETGSLAVVLAKGFFDATVISGRDGVGKPAPEAFHLALERLGCSAADACFVDDQSFCTEAAEAVGIKSFLFEGDATRLREQLRGEGFAV